MRTHALLVAAALGGLALPAEAQLRIDFHPGGHVRLNPRHARHSCEPRPCPPPRAHGHWRTVCEPVWIEGCWREEYVPPRYGWVCDPCGRRRWAEIEPGHTHRVWVPGRYENRTRRIWVPC